MSSLLDLEKCIVCEELFDKNKVVVCECGIIICPECLDKSCDFCPKCDRDLTEEAKALYE